MASPLCLERFIVFIQPENLLALDILGYPQVVLLSSYHCSGKIAK